MLSALSASFKSNEDTLPTLHNRLDVAEAREHKFYFKDIPAVNERMCGELIRTMDSHREALQLDATTVRHLHRNPVAYYNNGMFRSGDFRAKAENCASGSESRLTYGASDFALTLKQRTGCGSTRLLTLSLMLR